MVFSYQKNARLVYTDYYVIIVDEDAAATSGSGEFNDHRKLENLTIYADVYV